MAKSKSKTSVKKNVKSTTKNSAKTTTTKKSAVKKTATKKPVAKKVVTAKKVEKVVEAPKTETVKTVKPVKVEIRDSFFSRNKGLLIVLAIIVLIIAFTFLQEGSNKKDSSASAEVSTNPDVDTWVSDTKSDQYVITIIALSYCTYCQQYKPVITQIAADNNIKLYWYEIDTLQESDEEAASKLTSTYNLEQYNGSSPYTVITYGGNFVKDVVGYMPEEDTKTFLKEAGVIN